MELKAASQNSEVLRSYHEMTFELKIKDPAALQWIQEARVSDKTNHIVTVKYPGHLVVSEVSSPTNVTSALKSQGPVGRN